MTLRQTTAPTSETPRAAPGRPKDLNKRAAILEAAKRLFLLSGVDGVSMDQIAGEAGVSKLTVYSHFGDKESLFAAAVQAHCDQQLPDALFDASPDTPLRERLLVIARAFFGMVSTPEAIAGHRIMCTPQVTDSALPQMFWDAGPRRIQASFSALLHRRQAEGQLDVADPDRAASQFFNLVKGDAHALMVLGCGTCSAPHTVEAHLEASVDMFLRAYAPRGP